MPALPGDVEDEAEHLADLYQGRAADIATRVLDPARGYTNVSDYITFLRAATVDRDSLRKRVRGKTVAVIGGGSVALDSANTAACSCISIKEIDTATSRHAALHQRSSPGNDAADGIISFIDDHEVALLVMANRLAGHPRHPPPLPGATDASTEKSQASAIAS